MTDPAPISGDRPDPRRSLSMKIAVTVRQMHKRFDRSVAAIGITRSQWRLVAVVSNRPGITQREAAEILEMSEASVGRPIERLCAEGLLERRPKADDRRAYCLYVTAAAGGLLEKIGTVARDYEQVLFDGFSPDDLARLSGYLDRLAANVTTR